MFLGAFDDSRFKSKPKPLTLASVEARLGPQDRDSRRGSSPALLDTLSAARSL